MKLLAIVILLAAASIRLSLCTAGEGGCRVAAAKRPRLVRPDGQRKGNWPAERDR